MNQVKRLPPGWDTKCEPRTGKSYFVNYFTRHVTLEDPRNKEQTEVHHYHHPHENARGGRHVPFMGASAVQSNTQQVILAETVLKIRSMFPTVPETHIKALLLKYHGREAVVMSALQVEKHPVATPGPFTPPPARLQTRPSIVSRPQPKPHSPKMKLRYLKSVFPVVEETLLLDTLCNSDNNVTHATERLVHLGFNKKDTPPPRVSLRKKEQPEIRELIPLRPPVIPGVSKTEEEKKEMKNHLCQKYPNLPERVISLAMDSSSYNEDTAETILLMMLEEKPKKSEVNEEVAEAPKIIKEEAEVKTDAVPISPIIVDQKILKKRQKGRTEHRQVLIKETHIVIKEDAQAKNCTFESPLLIKPQGPNTSFSKGPDEGLLLEDYVPWIGAKRHLALGTNKSLCVGSRGAKGPDANARKGPQSSLAKGSIYSKFQALPGTRCN